MEGGDVVLHQGRALGSSRAPNVEDESVLSRTPGAVQVLEASASMLLCCSSHASLSSSVAFLFSFSFTLTLNLTYEKILPYLYFTPAFVSVDRFLIDPSWQRSVIFSDTRPSIHL